MTGFFDIPVVVIPALVGIALIFATRGICYFQGHRSTDNEKIVKMAGEFNLLSWPSRMHAIPYGRGHLREYWVIATKLLMKITGIKDSDHVNVVLALIANIASAILIFYIARSYFGAVPALFVFLLYVTCIWPYHVAIYMGHVHLSQAFFLSSILALRLTDEYSALSFFFYLASGLLIGISFSSSSASRKFPVLFVAAFLYQTRDLFVLPTNTEFDTGHLINGAPIAVFAGFLLVLVAVVAFTKPFGTAIVNLLNRRLGRDWSDVKRSDFARHVSKQLRGFAVFSIAVLAMFYIIQPDARWYANAGIYLAGIFLIAAHVLSPDIIVNALRYIRWLNPADWASHFRIYKSHEKEIFGRTLPINFRGEGIRWVPRFLMRMIPAVVVTYLVAGATIIGIYIFRVVSGDHSLIEAFLIVASLVIVSLLPILIAEQTRSLQVGKSYFSSLIGLLLLIGVAAGAIDGFDRPIAVSALVISAGVIVLLVQGAVTTRGLIRDLLPARMGPSRLYDFLKDSGVKVFYTYDNPYNNGFVQTMLYSHPGKFEVKYIDSISDVGAGIVVVPPTSSKSLAMESDSFGVQNGDFRTDRALAELLDSRRIEDIALAKINTFGSSRYFVHESEVTSYRDIILKQIGDNDRWLGHGWVIDAKNLRDGN